MERLHIAVKLDYQTIPLISFIKKHQNISIDAAIRIFDRSLKSAATLVNNDLNQLNIDEVERYLRSSPFIKHLLKGSPHDIIVQAYIHAYNTNQKIKCLEIKCSNIIEVVNIPVHPFFQKKVY